MVLYKDTRMLFLSAAWLLVARVTAGDISSDVACDACIDNTCYTGHSVVPIDETDFFPLAVDRAQNILYFGYKDINYNGEVVAALYLNDSSTVRTVRYSKDGVTSAAVDPATSDVYLYASGHRKIHKYNPIARKFIHVTLDKIIRKVQFKNDKLYFTYWKEARKAFSGEKFLSRVAGIDTIDARSLGEASLDAPPTAPLAALAGYIIDDFVVDRNEDIYFFGLVNCLDCVNKLYRLQKGSGAVETLSEYSYNLYLDRHEVAHFYSGYMDKTSVYRVDPTTNGTISVGRIKGEDFTNIVFDASDRLYYNNKYNKSSKLLYLESRPGSACKMTLL